MSEGGSSHKLAFGMAVAVIGTHDDAVVLVVLEGTREVERQVVACPALVAAEDERVRGGGAHAEEEGGPAVGGEVGLISS